MKNLVQFTTNVPKPYRLAQRNLQLVLEDRVLFVLVDLHVPLCGRIIQNVRQPFVSSIHFSFVNFALHPTPRTQPNSVTTGD